MRILCVGGGSGGHVTPIVAVVEELRHASFADLIGESSERLPEAPSAPHPYNFRAEESSSKIRNQISTGSSNPDLNHDDSSGKSEDAERKGVSSQIDNTSNLNIRIWTDKKFATQTRGLVDNQTRVDVIASGKLRRYANLTFWHKWFSWYHLTKTHLPNLIDLFKIVSGFFQSLVKLIIWRPDVVFAKGGYVCLPVGVAAHVLRIPLVIHDSDSVPGLTNRILARWAAAIGTGSPVENYPSYPKKKTKFVGIPVRPEIKKLSVGEKRQTKKSLNLDPKKELVFVMGGGGGAQIFTDTFQRIAPEIVQQNAQIVLSTGKGKNFTPDKNITKDFFVYEFLTDKYALTMNACDIFVTRAGVTGLAEAATVGVPTIIVPSPYLSSDHQTKNAAVYEKADAAIVLNQFDLEKDPEILTQAIGNILHDTKLRDKLRRNIPKFAKPDALHDMVKMILEAAKKS
ncbi:UDP-N-acetylglucosamine--N-acetylmuramyl-(pentapeptide) pyrophosphoryl-undecaprenol N-acetylglucosamine transferase [Candidatus Saccharibacteria bacterium]|nr:UDP-N-acetylglucosamine--N-acetylmuramyl-(pentapeptide) pyrophosphoryl-undecaprenol N-acetylglucosamine transferase [Candidatus Saccharibacteria bacterium]